jgi:esterase/lipase
MNRKLKITLWAVSGVLLAIFILVNIVGYQKGKEMVTFPKEVREPLTQTPADFGMPYEEVTVTTEDGLTLAGWYVRSKNSAAILAMHGYKGDREDPLRGAMYLHRHGYGVLIGSLRAHDSNPGELITFGLQEMRDFEAWYRYLLAREDVDPQKIGLYGISMGAVLSIKYATQNQGIKAVIADSAFARMQDTVEKAISNMLGEEYRFMTPLIVYWGERIADIRAAEIDTTKWTSHLCGRPVMFFQGGEDDLIPVNSGNRLFDAACEPKKIWYVPQASHSVCDLPELEKDCESRIVSFFDEYVLSKHE